MKKKKKNPVPKKNLVAGNKPYIYNENADFAYN